MPTNDTTAAAGLGGRVTQGAIRFVLWLKLMTLLKSSVFESHLFAMQEAAAAFINYSKKFYFSPYSS